MLHCLMESLSCCNARDTGNCFNSWRSPHHWQTREREREACFLTKIFISHTFTHYFFFFFFFAESFTRYFMHIFILDVLECTTFKKNSYFTHKNECKNKFKIVDVQESKSVFSGKRIHMASAILGSGCQSRRVTWQFFLTLWPNNNILWKGAHNYFFGSTHLKSHMGLHGAKQSQLWRLAMPSQKK